jgi:hypothetical protein
MYGKTQKKTKSPTLCILLQKTCRNQKLSRRRQSFYEYTLENLIIELIVRIVISSKE